MSTFFNLFWTRRFTFVIVLLVSFLFISIFNRFVSHFVPVVMDGEYAPLERSQGIVSRTGGSYAFQYQNDTLSLLATGLKRAPKNLKLLLSSPSFTDQVIKTPILYVPGEILAFDKAQLILPKIKEGKVNAILSCPDDLYDPKTTLCAKWDIIPFVPQDLGDKISLETTHFSAVAAGYVTDVTISNFQSNLTKGDIWRVKFNTYGTSDLIIEPADDRGIFGRDLEFKGLYCGGEAVPSAVKDGKIKVLGYSCEGRASYIENQALTGGVHKLQFTFGTTIAYAKNFACDSGTLATTCTVSTSQSMANNEEISGAGNLTIASGGELTIGAGGRFGINMTGGASTILIQSGGTISGNLSGATSTTFTIDSGGSINVSEKAPAGGTGAANSSGGAGHGGAGGKPSGGGIIYGSTTTPSTFGSQGSGANGGCCGVPAGNGGGLLKMNISGTLTINGTVSANGGNGNAGNGDGGGSSGGSIWFIAGTMSGSGSLSATGGLGGNQNGAGGGGGGRIALYATTFNLTNASINVGAGTATDYGNAGTLYIYDNNASKVMIEHSGPFLNGTLAGTVVDATMGSFQATTTNATTTIETSNLGWFTANIDVVVNSGKTMTVASSTFNNTITTIAGTLTSSSKGYAAAAGPGSGSTSAGGGHGGRGGASTGGPAYGSTTTPTTLGSGGTTGGGSGSGGVGGGAIRISSSATLTVSGTISTNGANGTAAGQCCSGGGGGGAGGSIYLVGGTIAGSGSITANGGEGAGANGGGEIGGGGGGGRIALYYKTKTYSGTPTATAGTTGSPAARAGTSLDDGTSPSVTITAVCSTGSNTCTINGAAASPQEATAVTSHAGTASDSDSTVSTVDLSIKDGTSGLWYNATSNAFDRATENFIGASGTTSWSYTTSAISWTGGRTYTIKARAQNPGGTITAGTVTLSFVFASSGGSTANGPASLTNVSDTLSTSATSTLAKHTIAFTTANALGAGETLVIQLDPDTNLFTETFSSATTTDITTSGMTLTATCSGAANEVTVVGNYNGGSNENLTFTVCSGDTVAAGAITVVIGASTKLWTNPATQGSYVIRITANNSVVETADLRVAAIDSVVMTASVASAFTLTITAIASGTSINSDPTNTSSGTTAISLPYGTLTTGTAKVLGHQIAVTTNATNGFSIGIFQNQDLTSAAGDTIDSFKDGNGLATPAAWISPTGTLDTVNTYGHFGFTSEDDEASSEFASTKYAALGTSSPRTFFTHDGPADGATANKGLTKIGFKIEIDAFQEAGIYTNTLTYVATPTY